jgi:CBS domain-containing protein
MVSIDSLMNRELVTARPDESVAQVVARMNDESVGAVVIVEGDELAGMFSERDLVRRVIAAGKDPAAVDVGSVATRDVVSVDPDAPLRRCAEILREQALRHLPVVEGRRVVGIISARDFFNAVAGELERFIERARYEEQLQENVDPYDHLGGSYGR